MDHVCVSFVCADIHRDKNLLGERIVVFHERLAVGRVFVEFDQLHMAHRIGLLDVRPEVEVVELVICRHKCNTSCHRQNSYSSDRCILKAKLSSKV